jgi:hypothetical protein
VTRQLAQGTAVGVGGVPVSVLPAAVAAPRPVGLTPAEVVAALLRELKFSEAFEKVRGVPVHRRMFPFSLLVVYRPLSVTFGTGAGD